MLANPYLHSLTQEESRSSHKHTRHSANNSFASLCSSTLLQPDRAWGEFILTASQQLSSCPLLSGFEDPCEAVKKLECRKLKGLPPLIEINKAKSTVVMWNWACRNVPVGIKATGSYRSLQRLWGTWRRLFNSWTCLRWRFFDSWTGLRRWWWRLTCSRSKHFFTRLGSIETRCLWATTESIIASTDATLQYRWQGTSTRTILLGAAHPEWAKWLNLSSRKAEIRKS